jgi:ketosteroid isomerase-like protein
MCTQSTTITTPDGVEVTGIAAIHAFVGELATRHGHFTLDRAEARGDAVAGLVGIANDYHRQVGVAPLQMDFRATVRDGKVMRFGGPFTQASLDKLAPLRASEQFYVALNALVRGNPSPMADVWSHAADVSTMHPTGRRQIGWEQVWQGWEEDAHVFSSGPVAVEHVTPLDLVLLPLSDNVACTLGTEHAEARAGGQAVVVDGRATNIYRRERGEWKMIHHHVDALPPEHLHSLSRGRQTSHHLRRNAWQ